MITKRTPKVVLLLIGSIIFLLITNSVDIAEAAQPEWSKTFGSYYANSVIQAADGGYLLAGQNASASSYRGFDRFEPLLIKTDTMGNLVWSQNYGALFEGYALEQNIYAKSVVQTQDNGYLLCGNSNSSGWILKTDSEGNMLWIRFFKISAFSAIQGKEGYVIVGNLYIGSTSIPTLIKTDVNGNPLWNVTFETDKSPYGWAEAVVQTQDSNYVVAGMFDGDFWIVKVDDTGNLLWKQTYPSLSYSKHGVSTFRSITLTKDNGFILAGDDGQNAYVFKLNAVGNKEWIVNYNGKDLNEYSLSSSAELSSGDYIAAGTYHHEGFLVRIGPSGNSLWSETLEQGLPSSVAATKDGGFVVAGALDKNAWTTKFALDQGVPTTSASLPELLPITALITGLVFLALIVVYTIKRRKPPST